MSEENQEDNKKGKGILKIIESSLVSIASSFPVAASLATGWSEYKNKNRKKELSTFYKLMD